MKSRVFSSLFFTTLFLVLLHSPFNSAQEFHENVQLRYAQSITMDAGSMKYYSINLSERPEDVDVSISALSLRSTSPKVYVSKNSANQFPKDTNTAEYYATSFSGNIVFIPASDLAGVQTLYIGLSCPTNSKCDTDVTFEYAREFNIQADGSRIVETSSTLKGASSAVVRLSVPDVPNAERIVIHVDAIPNDDSQVTPELNVFINYGTKIPATNSAENIPRTSWFEGRTIVIYKSTQLFCTNCNYTMSLKFDPYSSISIEAHVFEKDMELESNAILDGVQSDRYNTYSFTIPEEKLGEDFIVDVKPQQGKPTLYINCDTRPDDFRKYYWRYNIEKSTEVILTSREHEKCLSGQYFLLTTSREPSVYSIRLAAKSNSKLFVGKDAPVMGDIFPNETISYEIFVPLFAAEEIVVELDSEIKIDMDIINCRFPTDCPGLLPGGIEFRHQAENDSAITYNPPEFQYTTEELPNQQLIKINPHTAGCYPIIVQDDEFMQDPIPVCAYKISLSSQHQYPIEYMLKAISHGHQWLFVGLAKLDSVDANETAYYMLNVPQENATKVNIQLTKFSGDVNIYVSKTEKYPDAENDETEFSHEGMIIFQNMPDLSGTYFIGVHGIETSSYSLSATVMANNKTEDYAQTLTEGLPQKGILLPKHEHPARFYKFELDLDEDWEGVINVDINTLRGALLIAVNNNGMIPMPNLHMWKSTGRELQIISDDEYFNPKGTYYVGVFIDWSVRQPDFDDITFNIVYYVKEYSAWTDTPDGKGQPVAQQNFQHFFLSPLTPFHRTIKRTDIDYYEAFILPKDTGITLFKQADAGDVDLFVSLDPDLQYPDQNQYTYSTTVTHKDSIELTQEDLTKACENAGMKLCTFYVAVIPRGDVELIAYSLSMKRDYVRASTGPSLTPLEEGRQLQLSVPTNSTPAYFYFYIVPYHPSVITVSCPGEEIRIYANRNATEIGSGVKPSFAPPTADLYEFTSYTNETFNIGLAHLTIPAQNNMDSGVVTVSVYFKHPSRAGAQIDPSTTYSILVSSQMTHIYTGKPYHGAVEAGQYMYYSLNVFKPTTTLLISMTTLNDGDPDLVVSTSKDDPPTIASHQFASISNQKTELLEINNLDIYPKTSMEGTWVIGVYGRTNSAFTLTVLDESEKMVQLKADTPFEMYMREESVMYFKYYHGKPDQVEIRIDQLSGDVVAHVATLHEGDDIDIVSVLSEAANYKWDIIPSKSNALTITSNDEKACSECLYLIIVEARLSSKLSVTITEGDRFIKLQNGVTYTNQLPPLNSKKYLFTSSNAEEVTLSVNLKGEGLRIFASHNPEVSEQDHIWEAELTSDKPTKIMSFPKSEMEENPQHQAVWNGIEYVKSEKNSFYVMFENPNGGDFISYTFTVTSKDSSPILKPGSKHMMSLGENEATSLIYYSSKEDQVIKLNVEFEVEVDTADQSFDKILKKGVPVSATYWAERTTAGVGSAVELIKDHVMKDSVKSSGDKKTYMIREGFTLESKRGKYSFDLENPFSSTINVWATVYSSEFGTLQLDQNSQHSSVLSQGMSETYEVYLAKSGAWYLWAYSCLGDATIRVAAEPESLEDVSQLQTMRQSQDYMYTLYSEAAPTTQYARLQTMSQDGSLFVLSSKFFPSETRSYRYDLAGRAPKVQATYQYQALNSQITVNTAPLKIADYDAFDEIVYHVKLCPLKLNDPDGPQNVCNIHEDCRLFQVQYQLDNQSNIQATFDRLQPGNHYVHVVADIMHKNQLIKFIPYETETIIIDLPIAEKVSNHSLLIVILTLLGLIVAGFVCYMCYGRLQRFGEEKGFELPNIGKRRGYGFIGDDL